MMVTDEKGLEKIYDKLSEWLEDVKQHEVVNMVEVVEKAKDYLVAAERLPEEKIKQFISHLVLDLKEAYQHSKDDAEHSPYLGVMNEAWWQQMADITDKSQVEWAEVTDDLSHQGVYRVGDVVGFGILMCQQCGHEQTITHGVVVAQCLQCGHESFGRKAFSP